MKKKVLSMILAFAIIMVQIPASVYVLATDSGIDSAVIDSANGSSTGWTIDDVLDLIDGLPQADEVADESKVEVKIALNEALAVYSAAMEQADIDAEELRDAVGDERRNKLRALSDLLSDVEIPVLDSGIDAQMQAEFEMGRLPLMSQMLLRGSSPTSAVIGSAENPFLIGTPAVLAELAELTQNNEDYGTDMLFAAANYQLVADIDLAGVDGIQRIKDFKGTFDGDGHSVKNMKIAGLFATAEAGSVIKNLGIEDCKISCEGSVGGVAMYTNGAITNCYVTGTITGTDQFIGGVAGSAGISAVVTNCYAVVDVSGVDFVGGVVGRTTGTVTNCYVTGNVSGSSMVGGVAGVAQDATIANCYVTSNVSGNSMVGGEVGWAVFTTTMPTVTNCAALGQTVTGNSDVGRVVGLNGGYGSNISGCYAFSGMKIGASGSEAVVTGGAVDNQNGADLSYTASNAEGKLSAQFSAIFGSGNTAWNYTVDGLPTLNNVSGDQSSELPMWFAPTSFDISTAAQLDELRKVVNGGTSALGYTNTDDAVYNLINDIDLTGFDSDTDATNGNWAPIGNLDNPFNGTFEGNGYAIKNMVINLSESNVGLFGYAAVGAAIHNVGVENCTVTGGGSTGGVVGYAGGAITKCYSTGSVSSTITSTSEKIGGVVGYAAGAVTDCYTTASVSGVKNVGGVVGYAAGAITNCYATGDVLSAGSFSGGVVGFANDAVTNCYAAGSVSGSSSVGGVVGRAMKKVTNCIAFGQSVTGSYATGGVVGYASDAITNCAALEQTVTCSGDNYGRVAGVNNSTISGCYAWSGMKIGTSGSEAVATDGALDNKNGADYTGGNAQFSNIFNNDTAWNYTPGALPTLADVGGSQSSALPIWIGASGNVFAISTAEQLDELRQLVNNNIPSASGYTNTAESYYYLTADIDLVESGSVTPIGLGRAVPFRGTFDGKGYAVTNMTISSSDNVGLFGYTAGHSVIKNLGVENCDVTGGDYTGGVVGFATGMVTNCYSTGSVTGNKYVGGVVGSADTDYEFDADYNMIYYTGTVTGCHSSCTVSSSSSSSAYVGGVVGVARGTLTNCYATGSISGGEYACVGGVVGSTYGTVTNCYATGYVSGGNYAGGVVGSTYDSVVTNCYATGSVSGSVGAGGGVVGYTSGTVTNCYATGSVTGKENAFVGGVVGVFDSSTGTVKNCAALGKAAAGVAASRIVSAIYNGTVSACYGWNGMNLSGDNIGNNGTDLTYTATNAAGARLSAQFSTIFGSDAAWSYTADALPVLADLGGSQSSELPYWVMLGAGTEENPYIISTAAQLNDLRKVVNDGATSTYGYTNAAGRFYKLNANINLSGFDDDGNSTNGNWTPIGTYEKMFLGNFDG
ncbi:MAG: GLUG motif-containing protein, partial [Pygmaiobacter sp.]|nr:GLUG motif-containing protein [Pygmaiobacter sp.]